jgi:N6-L-threonylcarbamoyladenine synthase
MLILGIESSCDETAVAISRDGREILSNCVLSQIDMHTIYGGVVPEIASRKHIEAITALADQALKEAGITRQDLDAIAVTYAPGLIGALLVGVNFAKAAALGLGIPIIPVHHIRGHIAANYIAFPELEPPFVCLSVSGGNTLILDVRDYTDTRILGSTRDDAAGECFDKVARVLGMPYPGGKALDDKSQGGDPKAYPLPRSKVSGAELDMSFSGLKTAALNIIHNADQKGEELDLPGLCASFVSAVEDTLVPRTMTALKQSGYKKLAIAGGVAANSHIRAAFQRECGKLGAKLYMPPLSLCGDNGAMIACQGYYEYLAGNVAGQELNAVASLPVERGSYGKAPK